MKRVYSPGLSPWPGLYFCSKRRLAIVHARYASWHSYMWAQRGCSGLVVIVNLVVILVLWSMIQTPSVPVRAAATFIPWAICSPLLSMAVRKSFREPLAQIVFATSLKFQVTEKAIIFKSRLYRAPTVVWRHWKGRTIPFRFVSETDQDAQTYLNDQMANRNWPVSPLREAAIVSLVVTTPLGSAPTHQQSQLQRAIPIAELPGRMCSKLTTILSAAVMLVEPTVESERQLVRGADIDQA